ncbi:DUF6456 domain-containing protein [Pseudooceanicola sp. LIPI14-2-Ac024]|uniref:DUF6456 domain-containing protein n=1 Tax=Pseudooceanicola sp. LIPI14-2-Ac024 TaxID=3344875 RepID=UPI0035CFF720
MPGTVPADPEAWTVPSWVPEAALRYLAHTEDGQSIRALARKSGCHASTVLRQIRRVENLRDDILVDEVLTGLGRIAFRRSARPSDKEPEAMTIHQPVQDESLPNAAELRHEAQRVLRRLCEPGAVLAVAADMEKAVVVRDGPGGATERLAVLDRAVAQAMALKDWIACDAPGRVARYTITPAGRAELNRLMVQADRFARPGLSEAPRGFVHVAEALCGAGDEAEDDEDASARRRVRYGTADTPVAMLARRRDRDGKPFLDGSLVRAGERLAEDFELAQMAPRVTQNWDRFLVAGVDDRPGADGHLRGAEGARERVAGALKALGPGLGDVVLRCCCYQQGLETAEKTMGWSARSGKIVLRIALERLRQHYDSLGHDGGLIG